MPDLGGKKAEKGKKGKFPENQKRQKKAKKASCIFGIPEKFDSQTKKESPEFETFRCLSEHALFYMNFLVFFCSQISSVLIHRNKSH